MPAAHYSFTWSRYGMRADYYTAVSDPATQLGLRLWSFDANLGQYSLYERTDTYSYQSGSDAATVAPTTFDAPNGCRSSAGGYIVPPQPAGHEVGAAIVVSPAGSLGWGRPQSTSAPPAAPPPLAPNSANSTATRRSLQSSYAYDGGASTASSSSSASYDASSSGGGSSGGGS